ncbi:protein odr-4 homolog isoform X1 [Acipenser ruthenus]|uniref:protein odr-4 homolog isoform X1 n=1 Tax=Acipenser ruthenus TaxID=7906 RepID=UPI00274129FC|nr:protein odr-4 homolog isoform X1 [Acipenser ruthenus]XP_058890825.1 protein odr-4 homolog isoform X1 [Acipenser ruthenus]XP_058890826.1 protein odr-4 homolog isoform X1 [Acipenser ruthenus]
MGRTYFVEDSVEQYLQHILDTSGKACVTGLLIGQCSPQRDFVLLAVRTPPKETQSDQVDEEWVVEHATQVSRMLPGGLAVLGVFLGAAPELSVQAQNILRRLVFAVEKSITKARLWKLANDEVHDRVALNISSETKKVLCRTFDVKDPKSSAKPADWKYQTGLSASWPVLECNVEVDLQIPVPADSANRELDKCIENGLKEWVRLIQQCSCILNGKVMGLDKDLLDGTKKKAPPQQFVQQPFVVQFLRPSKFKTDDRSTALVQKSSGTVVLKGVVHCKAYIHTNKPKVKDAVQALKRDVLNTVAIRSQMLFEDFLLNPEGYTEKGARTEEYPLPKRVFVPLAGTGVTICDYMFKDEAPKDIQFRIKELLDLDVKADQLDMLLEMDSAIKLAPKTSHPQSNIVVAEPETSRLLGIVFPDDYNFMQLKVGVVIAAGVVLFAVVFSLFFFSD